MYKLQQFFNTSLTLSLLAPLSLFSVTWTAADDANWNDNGSWDGSFPNAIDALATFPNNVAADPVVVTLGQDITVGTVNVASQASRRYSFASGNSLIFDVSSGSASLSNTEASTLFSCPIVLNDNISISVTSTSLNLNGGISGTGNITKSGALNLSIGSTGTYTGSTTLSAGSTSLSTQNAIAATSGVTIASGATLLSATGGGPVIVPNVTGAGTIQDDQGEFTFQNTSDTTFSGIIQDGSFGSVIDKTGAASLTLSGTCTYTGSTTVSAGALIVTGSIATSSGVTVNSGGTIATSDTSLANLPASVTINTGGGLGFSISGTETVSTDFLTGNKNFSNLGSGTLTISGTPSYTGTTTASAGTLSVTGSIAASSSLTIANGATVSTTDISKLPSTRTINSGGTLNLVTSGSDTISGDVGGGAGGFQKTGTGTVTLSGTNTYTGPTTVSAGTLVVTGTINSSSTSTVASGATLKGTGTIGPAVIKGSCSPARRLEPSKLSGTTRSLQDLL